MRNLSFVSDHNMSVGLKQPVRARQSPEIMLDLPSRGDNPGPYSMTPKAARSLARRLTQMARFAEGK